MTIIALKEQQNFFLKFEKNKFVNFLKLKMFSTESFLIILMLQHFVSYQPVSYKKIRVYLIYMFAHKANIKIHENMLCLCIQSYHRN